MTCCDECSTRFAELEARLVKLEGQGVDLHGLTEEEIKVISAKHVPLDQQVVTIGGILIEDGDIVLLQGQRDDDENGLYICQDDWLVPCEVTED